MKDDSLLELRGKIDALDDEIFEALCKRMQLVLQVGSCKAKQGGAIYCPQREYEILQRLRAKGSQGFDISALEAIYREIFAISRSLELPEKVAFLGPIGSYTHQAAQEKFGTLSEYMPLHTITAVCESISHKRVKYGVLPLENNSNGIVGESIDNLVMGDLKIIEEVILPIHHSFLSHCERLGEIEKIFSKDIAFGQCQNFLQAHNLHHIEQIPIDSTSRAVQLACSTPKSAAIGSKIAGKLYNIPTMFDDIEDSHNNKTRFIIVSDFANPPSGRDKTSLFASPRSTQEVGDLFRLLGDFEKEGVNLTKIHSRPVRMNDDFKIGFFIECEGHYHDQSLQNLFAKRGDELKWLGSYMRAD